MSLTPEQRELCLNLYSSIDKKEDITDLLKQVEKSDFIEVFTVITEVKFIDEDEKAILCISPAVYAAFIDNAEALKAIFNYCKENGIPVEDVLSLYRKYDADLLSSTELLQFDKKKIYKAALAIFNQLKEVGSLKEFLFSMDIEADDFDEGISKDFISIIKGDVLEGLKDKLKSSGNQDALKKIYRAEKEIAANKAMKFGSIGGVMAALAVGGGLFAAGVALPILAIIGIAVAAALVTGLVAGGITYTVLKPSTELRIFQEVKKLISESQKENNHSYCV